MGTDNFQSEEERLDQAVAERLGKLRSMPVDTKRLESLLQVRIARPSSKQALRLAWWTRPMRAVAACLAVAAVIGALLVGTSGGPVLASATDMAQFHNDLVSGRVPVMHVDSMEGANKMLAAQWAQSPQIPNMPNDHVMACCMRSVKSKKMACVLLKGNNEPVTMTVANESDMQLPTSPVMTRDGIQYHVQSVGALNMVMTERNGRWICLIAELPLDRLMDLASSLQF